MRPSKLQDSLQICQKACKEAKTIQLYCSVELEHYVLSLICSWFTAKIAANMPKLSCAINKEPSYLTKHCLWMALKWYLCYGDEPFLEVR